MCYTEDEYCVLNFRWKIIQRRVFNYFNDKRSRTSDSSVVRNICRNCQIETTIGKGWNTTSKQLLRIRLPIYIKTHTGYQRSQWIIVIKNLTLHIEVNTSCNSRRKNVNTDICWNLYCHIDKGTVACSTAITNR